MKHVLVPQFYDGPVSGQRLVRCRECREPIVWVLGRGDQDDAGPSGYWRHQRRKR